MSDSTIRIPVEVLDGPLDEVQVEITDPTDGTVHTFSGPDEISVQRQIDQFWGIDNANQTGQS
ncbi:MAG: hypothetical protein U0R66_17425 [Mycobacterium sp.]